MIQTRHVIASLQKLYPNVKFEIRKLKRFLYNNYKNSQLYTNRHNDNNG